MRGGGGGKSKETSKDYEDDGDKHKHNICPLSVNIQTWKACLMVTCQRLAFLPLSKSCKNKFYVCWQCTYIVYLSCNIWFGCQEL